MDPPLAISVRVSISLIGLGLGKRDGAAESDGGAKEFMSLRLLVSVVESSRPLLSR